MDEQQIGLFEGNTQSGQAPLAYRSRPESLDGLIGQDRATKRLESLDFNNLPHIVLYGPPGCGKTTLALIISKVSNLEIFEFNAVLGGVNDLRKIIKKSLDLKEQTGKKSIIFIDEIHRFNKGQQDALLPYLEKSDFVLLGATTENPNTSLNKAILSRVQRWPLNELSTSSILTILNNASISFDHPDKNEVLDYIAKHSNGDARHALNQLELIIQNKSRTVKMTTDEILKEYLQSNRSYDKDKDRHYDVISAFIKSVRGSDVDAAILWLAVMIDGGEDIEFIARRLIILASEDIGNADPRALQMATSCHYAIKTIGMPEARIILSQATTYLANAPKSNSSYLAIDSALDFVRSNPTTEVPTHLRNHHPDKKNYKYPHSYENHWVKQNYQNSKRTFYRSSNLAYEKMQEDYLNKIKNN